MEYLLEGLKISLKDSMDYCSFRKVIITLIIFEILEIESSDFCRTSP